MFKKIVTIVLPIVAICAAIFVFGIKVYNDSYDEFQYDGYVIGTPAGKESTRYYFTKDNRYKVNETKDEVEFLNTDEKEVVVPNHAFVHYADGSIATFKKAVVMNVSNVKSSTIQYYNVYKGSVFTKATDGYQIKYLEQKLSFNNFLIKISETKYMLVGSSLQLKYGEELKTIKDGFLEINYLDGNIIRVENQDLSIQNISADLQIETDGVKVDLLNKKIMYNGETKVNLGEITIDSDDNIEIVPDEENTVIDGDVEHGVGYFENQGVTRPGVDITGMQSGIVDTSTKKPDEIVEENAKIADAEFDVKAIDVTASSVNVNIGITDKAGVLQGNLNWKVVENATNQIVCMGNQSHGATTLSFNCNQLAPDTNYSVIVRSAYTKNEINYEKDFVQKTFVTSTMGVTIDKDYVSTKAVSFLIKIDDYAGVSKFKYQLLGPEGTTTEKKTYTIPEAVEGVDPYTAYLTFEDSEDFTIRSNSRYTLVINEVEYGNERLSETYKISKTLTTLKATPKIGGSAVAINKQNSKFVLYLNNVTDPDNGVLNYRADIHEVLPTGGLSEIITKREAPAASEMTIDVDGTVISRKTNYRAKLYLTFFDNEKEYEIYLGNQDMNMNSASGPAVTFEEVLVTHERIKGEITISDPNETIDLYKEIQIIQQNMSYGTSTKMEVAKVSGDTLPDKKRFTFPIDNNNLKSNDSYLYTIMAWVDYKDENDYVFAEIGQFIINTKEPTALNATIVDATGLEENKSSAFTIMLKLDPSNVTAQGLEPNEMNTMQAITFRITGQEFDPSVHECVAAHKCWERKYTDDTEDKPYESSLKRTFFDNQYKFTATTFGIQSSDLTYGNYKFEILGAYDYTQYQNDLPINNSSIRFNPNASAESVINPKTIHASPVLNGYNNYVSKNYNLNDDTIIGYKIYPDVNLPSNDRDDYDIQYTLYNLATNQKYVVPDTFIRKTYDPNVDDGNNTIVILFNDIPQNSFTYQRGYPYAVSIKVTYNKTSKVEQVESNPIAFETQPEKQKPKLDLYLKTRLTNGAQVWQYKYSDIDGATVNDPSIGKTAMYSLTTIESWLPVSCGENYSSSVNCLNSDSGEFITKIDNGSMAIALNLELLKGALDSQYNISTRTTRHRYIDEMVFFNVIDYEENTVYKTVKGPNDVKFVFNNYSSSMLSQQVANVRITFTNGTTTKVIYKSFDNNGYENLSSINAQVTVGFSEIAELMGEAEISQTIDFLYDRNISGFGSENINNNGFALEEVVNSVKTLSSLTSKYKVFNLESFNYDNKVLKIKSLEDVTTTINFEISKKGLYYKNDNNQNIFVNLKQLHNKTVTCQTGDCAFTFSNVMPSLSLEDSGIHSLIGGLKFTGEMIIDSSIPDLVLRTRVFNVDGEGHCTGTEIQINDRPASEMEHLPELQFSETGLVGGKTYCVKFTWYKESDGANPNEKDFYYGTEYHSQDGVLDTREYYATTLTTPTLSNIVVRYDTGYILSTNAAYETAPETSKQHDNFNRSITVSFKADTIENYHGFKYRILDQNGAEIKTSNNITIEDSPVYSVDTFTTTFQIDASRDVQTITANTKYYLEIIPYRECTEKTPEELKELGLATDPCVGGLELLPPTRKQFTFYIIKPTIAIARYENATDAEGEFSIRIAASDAYRAAGGYSLNNPSPATYLVYATNDEGDKKVLGEYVAKTAYTAKIFSKIDHCKNSQTCTIQVVYEADLVNAGNKLQYTETKELVMSSDVDMGTSSVLSANTLNIKLGFADSYKITDVKTYDYTISSSETGATISNNDVEAVWTAGDGDNFYILDIPISLVKGRYSLVISFKDLNGVMVTSKTYDVFII